MSILLVPPSAPRSPSRFVLLVFVLSLPFWAVGAATTRQLMPRLPVSALMTVCPLLAALLLCFRERGARGARDLLRRAVDLGRIGNRAWYAPVLLVMPAVALLAYGAMRALRVPLPPAELPMRAVPGLALAFLAGALGEELGWSGYATDPLQARWGALGAGLLLGLVWATWHVVPLVQARRAPTWIAWWALGTIALRVLTVWLYNNTGRSVATAALFHATQNLAWQLFPNRGSHYDPRITGLVLTGVAAAVVAGWRPRTLMRAPGSRRPRARGLVRP